MPRRELLASSTTPDGEPLTLTREGHEYVVRVRGETLMSSRQSGSEESMAELAFAELESSASPRVLIGGLGMGFTLRAVLDCVGPNARVDVIELLDDVLRWNKGPLAAFANYPLDDPRVTTSVCDLLDYLRSGEHTYDAILLDIDNGPESFTVRSNQDLYEAPGLALLYAALCAGGIMVLWSAFTSPSFERRLRQAGFAARTVTRRARVAAGKGARHTLFVAFRPADANDS